jgi:hypothetical protein
MHPSHLAFSHLERLVSIARGLIASLKQRGQPLIGPCPLHHEDHPQAFVVDLSKDLWYRFTRCPGGGEVVSLVQRMDHCQYPQVARYLTSLSQVSATPARAKACRSDRAYQPYTTTLRLDPHAPLLAKKESGPKRPDTLRPGLAWAQDSSRGASQSRSMIPTAAQSATPVAGLIRQSIWL